jgi:hypothetical protein
MSKTVAAALVRHDCDMTGYCSRVFTLDAGGFLGRQAFGLATQAASIWLDTHTQHSL